jgi:serine/threonine protein kinase
VHPNLVLLIGYCIEKKRKATTCSLVLEFMAGGSLLERLRPAHADPVLTAQERFDVAGDVARALHYLHAEASPPLIHQDVKSDNILLAVIGGRLIAKVADFGTARIAPQLAMTTTAVAVGGSGGQTHHSTGIIVGTKPYMPPVSPLPSPPLPANAPFSALCSLSTPHSPLSP